ncbi:hypothetical protein MD484_g5246, partial [Candolleomyces efflorescens]
MRLPAELAAKDLNHVQVHNYRCTKLEKGTFRLGSLVEFQDKSSYAWRHWGCTTPKIISNLKVQYFKPSELDGYENLRAEDQAKIVKGWQDGHVDPKDVPLTARKEDAANVLSQINRAFCFT